MAIETATALSPGWWFSRLLKRLGERQDRLDRLDRYYRGDPDLPEGAEGCRPAYRQFQQKARTNFAQLIVEAVRDRMAPVGFRTGADGDELGDKEAWRIWQANQLDSDYALIARGSRSMGDAYVIVGGVDQDLNAPLITPEDPRQVITEHDAVQRRKPIAALKVFHNDLAQTDDAYLYLPGVVYRAARIANDAQSRPSTDTGGWEWVDQPRRLPLPVVPVVRFANRSDLAGNTLGEFEDVMDTLDRINHMLLQRLVIATMQAFRQRAVKGVPETDAQGNQIDYNGVFRADAGALWLLPPEAEIWESGQADLAGILSAVRHDIQDLAAVTRTPLFYLTPDAANGSAEGASLAREGLVFKVKDRLAQDGEALEQTMALAFAFAGDNQRASRPDMEVIWAPPERFSLAERYDAATKAQAAGVPWRTVMSEVLQFSPQQTERLEAERAVDAFLNPAPEPAALTVATE